MKRLLIIIIAVALCVPFASAILPMNITESEAVVPGFPATNAIDGNPDTYTRIANGNANLRVCFPSLTNLTSFSGWHAYDGHDTLPRDIRLSNRSDFATYTAMPVSYGSSNTSDALNPVLMSGTCFWVGTDGGWGGFNMTEVSFAGYNATYSDLTIIADFTAAPESGPASLYVMFNDTSIGAEPMTYNWSWAPSTGVLWDNATSETPAGLFNLPGNYSITHCAANEYASNCTSKNVTVYNSTSDYVTTEFVAMDEPRWVQLSGANIYLNDVENDSWVNATPSTTGYLEITTLADHTINAYSDMLGYSDGELLAQIPSNLGTYRLLMYPDGYDNVSAGNVTLYVHVHGSDVLNVEGAAVNIAYNYGGSQQNNYAITDESGFGKFVVPNQTLIYIYAEKVGYARAGTTQNSGNGNGGDDRVTVEITLQRSYVTTTPTTTVTTLPGGGTPTPTVTVDPYPCDADHPENCQRKQTDMANILVQYGPMLVMFFIALTIIGGVKQIGR